MMDNSDRILGFGARCSTLLWKWEIRVQYPDFFKTKMFCFIRFQFSTVTIKTTFFCGSIFAE